MAYYCTIINNRVRVYNERGSYITTLPGKSTKIEQAIISGCTCIITYIPDRGRKLIEVRSLPSGALVSSRVL